jgi:hypothetical protein
VAGVASRSVLMVDSGAVKSCVHPGSVAPGRLHEESSRQLFDISGKRIPSYGRAVIDYKLKSGRVFGVRAELAEVTRNVLSVGQTVDSGLSMVFTPHGAWMTKVAPTRPEDYEPIAREGGLYYLLGDQVESDREHLVAPIAADPEQNAFDFRDFDPDAVVEAEAAHDIVPDAGRDEGPPDEGRALEPRVKPPDEQVRIHEARGHLPYENWCLKCQAAKSRGEYYKKIPSDELRKPTVHCDYTYFSVEGTEICSSYELIDRQKAIPVFVAYDLNTGYAMAQQVSKKGADAHTIANMRLFLEELGYAEVVLRGDSENALQSLLRSVKESMTNVVKCEVQGTVTGGHQSIGAAERYHQTLAGQVRLHCAEVFQEAGFEIVPGAPLFAWVVRHSCWMLNRYGRRADGTTPHHAATGRTTSAAMAQLGETVHVKIHEPETQGKSKPRWYRAVWAGATEKGHVVLTPKGAVEARSVQRLPPPENWDREMLLSASGLPWARYAAGIGRRRQ